MKWLCRPAVAAALTLALAAPARAGQVRLEIRDGMVSLDAKDATVGEILSEWARVGRTTVVNADQVQGGPLTLQLSGVPERQALETVLRSAPGFVAAPRRVPQPAGSEFDRIMIMPGARPAAVTATATPATAPPPSQPPWLRGRIMPQPPTPNATADDQDEPLPTASMPLPGAQGAAQPGMMTPSPPNAPYGGLGQNAPPQAPTPYNNPTGAAPPQSPQPNSAPRPGMPTPPIKEPPKDPTIR
jgi:hypothetical protein